MARDDLQEGREEGEKEGKWLGGGGGRKRGREVSTVGKTLRGLTGGEVVQASPSLISQMVYLTAKTSVLF